jgi:hypothetical protein
MTSVGSRKEMSLRGLVDTGLPPLLTFARANISSVSSGSSSYSLASTKCASKRARSDFEERRDALLFTFICFPHTEDVTNRATRRVANNDHSAFQKAKTDDAGFTIVLAKIFNLNRDAFKDYFSVSEIKPSVSQRLIAFGRVEGDFHLVIVYTIT